MDTPALRTPPTSPPRTGRVGDAWRRASSEPAYGAFLLLRMGFTVLPIWMGIDKFTNALADWPQYLAPWTVDLLPFSAQTAMYVVGVVEIVAGLAVAIKPRYAAYVVAIWLAGIIVNLLTHSGFYDVALRDFGLLLAALTLARLAVTYDPAWFGAAAERSAR
ncbi:DoxX family membrane protein [Promicromonospora aerolata]|uniref:DoxX family membrane protein n=1 Tax=Promicromonospora aerolata TaxID=195749 RepID=A0ABW4V920_9MICO